MISSRISLITRLACGRGAQGERTRPARARVGGDGRVLEDGQARNEALGLLLGGRYGLLVLRDRGTGVLRILRLLRGPTQMYFSTEHSHVRWVLKKKKHAERGKIKIKNKTHRRVCENSANEAQCDECREDNRNTHVWWAK